MHRNASYKRTFVSKCSKAMGIGGDDDDEDLASQLFDLFHCNAMQWLAFKGKLKKRSSNNTKRQPKLIQCAICNSFFNGIVVVAVR